MSDIVETLRQGSLNRDDYRWIAADEITRLRAENERLKAALRDIIADSFSVYAIQVARAALDGQPIGEKHEQRDR